MAISSLFLVLSWVTPLDAWAFQNGLLPSRSGGAVARRGVVSGGEEEAAEDLVDFVPGSEGQSALANRLAGGFGPTVWSEFGALAMELGDSVVNLGQGFPDFAPPAPILAATEAAVRGGLTKYTAVSGTAALREAIAAHLNLDADDVQRCLASMSSRGVSMDKPIGEGGATVATVVPDSGLRQDVRMERTQNSEGIASALKTFAESLNERQRDILAGRIMHDLLGREQRCAKTFGVSKQRVGQIEKALRNRMVTFLNNRFGAEVVRDMVRASF